jgi:hypothetical protein
LPRIYIKKNRVCSVDGCSKRHWAKDYCAAHLYHFKKHGDALAGGTRNGEPLRFLNEVVMSHEGETCIKWPFANAFGYGQIYIDGHVFRVTRVVCERVHGPAPSPTHDSAHSCGKGHEGCCSPHHLSWKTHAENMADAKAHGTWIHGEKVPQSKLTSQQIKEIRQLEGKMLQREIAALYGTGENNISRILSRKSWAHIA